MLKYRDAVLAKINSSLTYNALMMLKNVSICNSLQVFPPDPITKAGEKSSCAFCDEAMYKDASFENQPPQSFRKSKAQSQSSRPRSSFGKCSYSTQSTKTTSGSKEPAAKPSSQTPNKQEKGKKFLDSLSSYATGGIHIRVALACLVRPQGVGLDSGDPSFGLPCSILSPPTFVTGADRVSFLWLRVFKKLTKYWEKGVWS